MVLCEERRWGTVELRVHSASSAAALAEHCFALCSDVLGDQFSLEAAYRVGVRKDCLDIVLRLVIRSAGSSSDEEHASPDVD